MRQLVELAVLLRQKELQRRTNDGKFLADFPKRTGKS